MTQLRARDWERRNNGIVVPKLIIGEGAWKMVQAYVDGVDTEINGFGYVRLGDDGVFRWMNDGDVFITQQTVTEGTVDVTGRTVAKAEYQALRDGRREQLRLQWHSHVLSDAYHSFRDMSTIESYGTHGVEWFISLVTNQHQDVTARLDVYRPVRIGAPMEVELVCQPSLALYERAAADIAALVTVEDEQPSRQSSSEQPLPVIQLAP